MEITCLNKVIVSYRIVSYIKLLNKVNKTLHDIMAYPYIGLIKGSCEPTRECRSKYIVARYKTLAVFMLETLKSSRRI